MKFGSFPKFALMFAVACALVALAACGGSNTLGLTQGNWAISATSVAPAKGIAVSFVLGGNLTQHGSNLSGTMSITQSLCFTPQTISFTGTVKDKTVTLTSESIGGEVISVTGTGTKDSLTGTYTVTGECADQGTVTASAVPSITGTWNGTISNATRGPNGIADATVSVALAQAATASENGTFALSGTLTYTNSVCSSSGTITSGSLAGSLISMAGTTADNNEGQGTFDYTSVTLDSITAPKNMTGTYHVGSGLCNGQEVSLTLTKQ